MHLVEVGFALILMLMQIAQGTDYLVALPHKSFNFYTPTIVAQADASGGTLHYIRPNYGWRRSVNIGPWRFASIYDHSKSGTTSEIENKANLIICSNSVANVNVHSRYTAFAPLPTTALGTKYIVSSCCQAGHYSLLVVAAYNVTTTVSVKTASQVSGHTFDNEITHKVILKPFHTFTFEHHSDLTGTVVESTQPIGLFSGMTDHEKLTAYEQLLPVRLYDKEYVVAVDNNPSLYHLQILSEQSDTVITFNNGSSLTVDSNLYQAQLMSEERFYFQSSNPVMVTICRRNGKQSGFVVIPSVFLYSVRVVSLTADVNHIFITREETFINSSDTRWTHIPNSGFKTGVLARESITTKAPGCTLVFYSFHIRTNGVTFGESPQIDMKKSYLLALPKWTKGNEAHCILSSSQNASYQVVFPHRNEIQTRQLFATSSDNFFFPEGMKFQTVVEDKAIQVLVETEETQLSVVINNGRGYNNGLSSIYPTSLLGREYIVQTCHGNISSQFQLIMVSSYLNTDINIILSHSITYDDVEYKPGDTIRVRLQPYQTLTINSSVALCGTSVSASNDVAVFTLSRFEKASSYVQLLPVRNYGHEYIVAANDQGNDEYISRSGILIKSNHEYYILVTSATELTRVNFSDDFQVTLGEGKSYRKDLRKKESLYISSTTPVIVSLCIDTSTFLPSFELHKSICTAIVPANLYTTESVFAVTGRILLYIVTNRKNLQAHVLWSSTNSEDWNVTVNIKWEVHTYYKIGSAKVDEGQISISSRDRFTILTFSIQSKTMDHPYLTGGLWNPIGWNKQEDNTSVGHLDNDDMATTINDVRVNIDALTIGISLSVLILVLLAATMSHHIYIRCTAALGIENKHGRIAENETSFNQEQPQDTVAVSSVSTTAVYSSLYTEPHTKRSTHHQLLSPRSCTQMVKPWW